MLTLPGTSRTRSVAQKGTRGKRPALHVHWFYRVGDDAFSGASLYACRCGVVRPGL